MSAAEDLAFEITHPLTWGEICARYPDEWVCMVEVDYVHPNGMEIRTARVISHAKSGKAALKQADPWFAQYDEISHFFTGRMKAPLHRPVVIIDDETRDAFRYPR